MECALFHAVTSSPPHPHLPVASSASGIGDAGAVVLGAAVSTSTTLATLNLERVCTFAGVVATCGGGCGWLRVGWIERDSMLTLQARDGMLTLQFSPRIKGCCKMMQ